MIKALGAKQSQIIRGAANLQVSVDGTGLMLKLDVDFYHWLEARTDLTLLASFFHVAEKADARISMAYTRTASLLNLPSIARSWNHSYPHLLKVFACWCMLDMNLEFHGPIKAGQTRQCGEGSGIIIK